MRENQVSEKASVGDISAETSKMTNESIRMNVPEGRCAREPGGFAAKPGRRKDTTEDQNGWAGV